MLGELPSFTQDRAMVFSEFPQIFQRMTLDISKPSTNLQKNRLADVLDRCCIFNSFNQSESVLIKNVDILISIKIPELVMLFRNYTKGAILPSEPKEFFRTIGQARDWSYRNVGITRENAEDARGFFTRSEEVLGQVPSLWLMTGVIDTLLKGVNITNPDKIDEAVRGLGVALPKLIRRELLFGIMSVGLIRGYVHPSTIKALSNVLEHENNELIKAGIKHPSTIYEVLKEK